MGWIKWREKGQSSIWQTTDLGTRDCWRQRSHCYQDHSNSEASILPNGTLLVCPKELELGLKCTVGRANKLTWTQSLAPQIVTKALLEVIHEHRARSLPWVLQGLAHKSQIKNGSQGFPVKAKCCSKTLWEVASLKPKSSVGPSSATHQQRHCG